MFSEAYRLRSEKDIQTLFARGKGVFGVYGGLKYRPNGLPTSRCTIVVGTKVAKLAVDRNRIKRRMREVVRLLAPHIRPGYDLLFMPKNTAGTVAYPILSSSITQLIKKASLYI